MRVARNASASQILSQEFEGRSRNSGCEKRAAIRAVKPRRTCPQPGTAVKEAERSMVSRMKRRSAAGSVARIFCVASVCAGRRGWRRRWWRGASIYGDRVASVWNIVKYFVM